MRAAAARTEDAGAARRMLAIALVLEGWSRQDAAGACAMNRQTLRDWMNWKAAAQIVVPAFRRMSVRPQHPQSMPSFGHFGRNWSATCRNVWLACVATLAGKARSSTQDSCRSAQRPGQHADGKFFDTLKVKLVHQRHLATRDEAERQLFASRATIIGRRLRPPL